MAKKKRSAAQRANDRRLGQMAKKRAAAKRKKKVAKKTRRKANPKRKQSAKSHLWVVFKCHGNSVKFASALGYTNKQKRWTTSKGNAVLFKTKSVAASAARMISKERGMSQYIIGVANAGKTPAQIRAGCQGK